MRTVALVVTVLMSAGDHAGMQTRGSELPAVWDLTTAFQMGPLLQDRNGDGVVDFEFLKLIAAISLQWDKASLDYLFEGKHRVDRRGESFWGGVTLSLSRERPARP